MGQNKIKLLLVILITSSTFLGEFAQNQHQTTPPTGGMLQPKQSTSKRRLPSNNSLEFEYILNGIYLCPSHLYESAELTVENPFTTEFWSITVSEENGHFLETGELHGTYSITAITDNGTVYYGEISVD